MEPPGGANTPPGGICVRCRTGQIEVIVWKHAVCWDTPREGEFAPDPRLDGVKVKVGSFAEKTTGPDGKVIFDSLLPASYTITVEKPGYEDVTGEVTPVTASRVILTHTVQVHEHETSCCDLVMRAKPARLNNDGTWTPGRECLRRHTLPVPQPATPGTLAPILWAHEPAWLVFRDILWILTGASALLCTIVGLIGGSLATLSVAAICAAFFGYLGAIIFGEPFGIPAIVVAAALFAADLVANLLAAAFGFAQPDPYGVGILAGIWTAFSIGYLPGRRREWGIHVNPILGLPSLFIWASGLIGAVAAGLTCAIVLIASGQRPDLVSLIFAMLFGAFLGALSGWAGYAFANEGKTEMPFGATDFKLPFFGERYCLQGIRGFWSHYDREEASYDFSMPVKTEVLCAKEGHIVAFYEDLEEITTRGTTNYFGVRHRDGSISRYGYFGTTRILPRNPFEERLREWGVRLFETIGALSAEWHFSPFSVAPSRSDNPPHVNAGHVLGRSGEPCQTETHGSCWWVLVMGIVFSVLVLAVVFGAGLTAWKGEPPKTVFTNTPGGPFERLFNSSDTNYSYGVKLKKQAEGDQQALAAIAKVQEKMAHCPVPEKFDQKFCECLQLGPVEQLGNTFSNFGFIIYGLIILGLFASSGPDRQPYPNRMTAYHGYTITYGLVAIFMGPGSMLLHSSMTASGGIGDGLSMYCFGGFLLAYNWVRLQELDHVWFYVLFLGSVIFFTALNFVMLYSDTLASLTTLLMVVLIVPALILHILVWNSSKVRTGPDSRNYFLLSVAFFVAAFGIWLPSYSANFLCQRDWPIFSPQSPIQGHAFWHIFAATAVFMMYFHFKHQEETLPVCPSFARLHFTVSEAPSPGPSVDQPEAYLPPGGRLPELVFKPVKFSDPSTAIHENRPWSMRKYLSSNPYLGLPPEPYAGQAAFQPQGMGEHMPVAPIEGPGDFPVRPGTPGSPPVPDAPGPPPSMPTFPPVGIPPSVPV